MKPFNELVLLWIVAGLCLLGWVTGWFIWMFLMVVILGIILVTYYGWVHRNDKPEYLD